MDKKININHSLRLLFIYWNILGFCTDHNKYLMRLYKIFVTCIASITFPAHIVLAIVFAQDREVIFSNGTIAISLIACTLKHFLLYPHLDKMLFVNEVIKQLDGRVQNVEDSHYYVKYIRERSTFLIYFFTIVYFSVSLMATLKALWTGDLLYPGYIFLDWHSAPWIYWLTFLLQEYALNMQVVQNLTNDAYGPIVMCTLSGHVHLLGRRVARIGHGENEKRVESNYAELVKCIEDYKLLLSTTRIVERIISHSYMVQFIAVAINVVVGLIYLLFYGDNMLSYLYYISHIVALMCELFPCCYYGSMVQAEFHALSYAIFRSNWFTQPRLFRRNVVTFVELTLKDVIVSAGGMMRIHIVTFFKTLKMCYSLFTVMQSMKR